YRARLIGGSLACSRAGDLRRPRDLLTLITSDWRPRVLAPWRFLFRVLAPHGDDLRRPEPEKARKATRGHALHAAVEASPSDRPDGHAGDGAAEDEPGGVQAETQEQRAGDHGEDDGRQVDQGGTAELDGDEGHERERGDVHAVEERGGDRRGAE